MWYLYVPYPFPYTISMMKRYLLNNQRGIKNLSSLTFLPVFNAPCSGLRRLSVSLGKADLYATLPLHTGSALHRSSFACSGLLSFSKSAASLSKQYLVALCIPSAPMRTSQLAIVPSLKLRVTIFRIGGVLVDGNSCEYETSLFEKWVATTSGSSLDARTCWNSAR